MDSNIHLHPNKIISMTYSVSSSAMPVSVILETLPDLVSGKSEKMGVEISREVLDSALPGFCCTPTLLSVYFDFQFL